VKKQLLYVTFGLISAAAMVWLPLRGTVQAHDEPAGPPLVFQAAGPNAASIQSTVDQFRAALGAVNNGNAPGPLDTGRREINWDGGGSTATAIAATPFAGFLNNRGALFKTYGSGFVQAPVSGLATTFGNDTYETIFQPFSAARLFSPIDSTVTDVFFFVPGGGNIPAVTRGFGVVFSDVDRENGPGGWDAYGRPRPGAVVEYQGVNGPLFSSFVPAAAGDSSLSFFGIVFSDPRIAVVRIRSGSAAPGPHDNRHADIVMMDDFVYGEPRAIPPGL
jgi:hypothetical protein